METILLPKPFKVLTDNLAATTFVKQALDNGPHMRNYIDGGSFYLSLMLCMSMF